MQACLAPRSCPSTYPACRCFARSARECRMTFGLHPITNCRAQINRKANSGCVSLKRSFSMPHALPGSRHFIKGVFMPVPFKLAPLPWDEDALAPTISANTISFHYHKHHQTYVDTLNKLVEGTKYADMKLEEIVRATAGASDAKEKQLFNTAGQVWNL